MDGLLDIASVTLARHKIDAAQYMRMVEAGILRRRERVELIEGEVIDMAPIGPSHDGAVMVLNHTLVLACDGCAHVLVQGSLKLNDMTMVQPDFAVFRFRDDAYVNVVGAGPNDALLIVEVSDSSLAYDRRIKLGLYARAGIPEYWIVNVQRKVVEVYREPDGDTYASLSRCAVGDTVSLAADPSIAVTFGRMFA